MRVREPVRETYKNLTHVLKATIHGSYRELASTKLTNGLTRTKVKPGTPRTTHPQHAPPHTHFPRPRRAPKPWEADQEEESP